MNHIEDLILIRGLTGARDTIEHFRKMFHLESKLSIKYDGAPAFKCRWEGDELQVFYKTSKIPHSFDREMKDENLRKKLNALLDLKCLPRFQGDLWGDYLFSKYSTAVLLEGGMGYQPNTLIYKWPTTLSRLGVAFHTYEGPETYESIMEKVRTADVYCPDLSAQWIGDAVDLTELVKAYNELDFYADIMLNVGDFSELVLQFFNDKIRSGKSFTYAGSAHEILDYIRKVYVKRIGSKKQQKTRDVWAKKLYLIETTFVPHRLNSVLRFMEEARAVKLKCINRLNRSPDVWVWHRDNGIERANHEGYVLSGFETVKLVDRDRFSHYNFSSDYIKGWESYSRK